MSTIMVPPADLAARRLPAALWSVKRDACVLDDLGPVVMLGTNEPIEALRLDRHGVATDRDETRLQLGHRGGDILLQPFDRGLRRTSGREQADPGIDVEARHA